MREYRRKAKNAARSKATRVARRAMLHDLKSVPCARCGESFPPVCMDFHHRDPTTKSLDIASVAGTIGLERLLAEIEKCDVLCANCHRIVEHVEKEW